MHGNMPAAGFVALCRTCRRPGPDLYAALVSHSQPSVFLLAHDCSDYHCPSVSASCAGRTVTFKACSGSAAPSGCPEPPVFRLVPNRGAFVPPCSPRSKRLYPLTATVHQPLASLPSTPGSHVSSGAPGRNRTQHLRTAPRAMCSVYQDHKASASLLRMASAAPVFSACLTVAYYWMASSHALRSRAARPLRIVFEARRAPRGLAAGGG